MPFLIYNWMKPNIGQGDKGKTRLLGGGQECNKDDPQVEAYGTIDELNSVVGVIRAQEVPKEIDDVLAQVQDDLFCIEAHVSAGPGYEEYPKLPAFGDERVKFLEERIVEWEKGVPPLQNFILPGGMPAAAFCDLARTVSRRAERRMATWLGTAAETPTRNAGLAYLNRLSDFFFALERFLNHQAGTNECMWKAK